MVATVVGAYGPSLGSHHQVVSAPSEAFTVAGVDTRTLMIRRLWGARVLQGGRELPDCEINQRWTFTLFPGERAAVLDTAHRRPHRRKEGRQKFVPG
jgi:hypothetical protein